MVSIMSIDLCLLMMAYYILKTVREPWILTAEQTTVFGVVLEGANWKIFASGCQAVVLTLAIPLYGWFTSRVKRRSMLQGVLLFFVACIELFSLGNATSFPMLGPVFYVWVGIFSLVVIAQFWSFATDVYRSEEGERLFPFIALGATVGGVAGALIARWLFKYLELGIGTLLHISAGLLLAHMMHLLWSEKRPEASRPALAEDSSLKEVQNGFAHCLHAPLRAFDRCASRHLEPREHDR